MKYEERALQAPDGMDLLAEEWALRMLNEQELPMQDCVFQALGDHGRSHRQEIARIKLRNLPGTDHPVAYMELRRNGLYDGLPEALFHEAGSSRTVKQNAVEDRNEQHAREFFRPFEQELWRLRVALRAQEHDLVATGTARVHGRALASLWLLPDFLASAERAALLQVLPLVPQVYGDLPAVAACFAHVLGHAVRISQRGPGPVPVHDALRAGMGEMALGGNSVVGDRFFDGWPGILVAVEGIPVRLMAEPVRYKRLRTLARVLAEHFLPAHLDVEYAFTVSGEDEGITLGSEGSPALLAMNTRI